jgi:ankyrin repeat protein
VNVHDNRRSTPLHFAASEGHLEVARMLLERKANVNALDDDGSTPLHQASQYLWSEDPDIAQLVRLLLDDGADIHALDNSGNTPLHFAASEGHLEVARMLLELKADVNALNKEGSTPLHQAFETWRENPDIMRLLLDHGADANVHDKSGNTLLHFAASEGDLELARILLERIPEVVDSQNDDVSTAFLLALRGKTLTLRGYYSTTIRMCTCATSVVILHCMSQCAMDTLTFVGYYSNAMRRSIPRLTTALPHFFLRQSMELLISCSYCWTIMLMCMCATPMETHPLHCAALAR